MSADKPVKSRKRAVKLDKGAIELLQGALDAAWTNDDRCKKLTREERAALLGVSVATADRIVAGKGVDRRTLVHAFRNVGLQWKSGYCLAPDGEIAGDCEPAAEPITQSGRRRLPIWAIVVGFVGLAGSATLLAGKWNARPAPEAGAQPDLLGQFARLTSESMESFQRAQYDVAAAKLTAAEPMVKQMDSARALATWLRLSGDLAEERGDLEAAERHYSHALQIRAALGEGHAIPALLEAVGDIQTRRGNLAQANATLQQSLAGYAELNDRTGVSMANRDLGTVASKRKNPDEALRRFHAALSAIGDADAQQPLAHDILARRALVWRDQGRLAAAEVVLRRCLRFWVARNHPRWVALTEAQLATVELKLGNRSAALELFDKSRKGFLSVNDGRGKLPLKFWLDD